MVVAAPLAETLPLIVELTVVIALAAEVVATGLPGTVKFSMFP